MVNVTAIDPPTLTCTVPGWVIRLAGTVAVSWVLLTTVELTAVPLINTDTPAVKPVPLIVSVNAGPPAGTEDGEMLVIVGVGDRTVKESALEAWVPGSVTVTCNVAGCWTSVAGTAAVSWVLLTNVVANGVVPRNTVAPEKKFDPFTVSVNAGPPCGTVAGERLVSVGTGAVMPRLTALDAAPPTFATVICTVPG
jgi:hypothetical protein